jgi:hypothetical protein
MRPHTSIPGPATPEQLVYLWLLARQTGTTFSPAQTRQQVRREIQLLAELKAGRDECTEPPATQSSIPTPRRTEREPFELGHYQTQAGERRALYGVLIEGRPRIVDASAEGPGRMYTVQENLRTEHGDHHLDEIVAAYIAQAQRLGRIPLAPPQQ